MMYIKMAKSPIYWCSYWNFFGWKLLIFYSTFMNQRGEILILSSMCWICTYLHWKRFFLLKILHTTNIKRAKSPVYQYSYCKYFWWYTIYKYTLFIISRREIHKYFMYIIIKAYVSIYIWTTLRSKSSKNVVVLV